MDENLEAQIQKIWEYITSDANYILTGKQDGLQSFKLDEFADKLTIHKMVSIIKDKFHGRQIERTVKENHSYHQRSSYSFNSETLRKLVEKYDITIPSLDHPLYKGLKGPKSPNQLDPSDPLDAHIRCYYDQLRQ